MLACDITSETEIERALAQIDKSLDVFVNTIGTFSKGIVSELTSVQINDSFNVNAFSNINLTRKVLPKMNNVSSQMLVCLATVANHPRAELSLQSAYKAFLDSLRAEVSPNIRISLILPASVQTDIFKKSGHNKDLSKSMYAEDVARIMKFIISLPENITIPEIEILNNIAQS